MLAVLAQYPKSDAFLLAFGARWLNVWRGSQCVVNKLHALKVTAERNDQDDGAECSDRTRQTLNINRVCHSEIYCRTTIAEPNVSVAPEFIFYYVILYYYAYVLLRCSHNVIVYYYYYVGDIL